jgi:hypothetical protein
MDGLKQVAVVSSSPAGSEILGLRADGILFRGQVSIDQTTWKVSVLWTPITEEIGIRQPRAA